MTDLNALAERLEIEEPSALEIMQMFHPAIEAAKKAGFPFRLTTNGETVWATVKARSALKGRDGSE